MAGYSETARPAGVDSVPSLSPSCGGAEKDASVGDGKDDSKDEEHDGNTATVREGVVMTGADVSNMVVDVRDDGGASLTFRGFVLGAIAAAFDATMSQIYAFKPVQVSISNVFLLLIIYVLGTVSGTVLPTASSVRKRLGERQGFTAQALVRLAGWVNPGPFGLKEHAVATLTASSASNGVASISVFAVQKLFYTNPLNASTAILATLSIGLFGYGLTGLLRPVTVYPSEMVYWGLLPLVKLFQVLHWDSVTTSKRLRAFWYGFTGMTLYEIIPSYIFPTLNAFSIPCLASQKAPVHRRQTLTNLFGGSVSNEGLGLFSLSFDWQYLGSQYMALPLVQQANSWVGLIVCYVAFISVFYNNVWSAKSFPFLSTALFASNGSRYHQTAVFVNGSILDEAALQKYGIPHFTGTYAWATLTANLAIGALIMQCILFWGKDIVTAFRQVRTRTLPDRHWVAMQKYEEAPWWWYLSVLVVSFVFGLVVVLKDDTTLPWWGYIVALLVGALIAPFSTILFAMMGNGIATSQLMKMIAGAIHPGRPLANLYFSAWSHSTIAQSLNLAADLKMGQYLKIPPRVMFITQVWGTVLGAFINYAVMISIVNNKRELLLDPNGNYIWSGLSLQGLNSQAVAWSLSKFLFGREGPYFIAPLGLLIGAFAIVVHWLVAKVIPRIGPVPTNRIILPVIFNFSGWMATALNSTIWSQVIIGLVCQWWLRTRRPKVFKDYLYVVAGGLDGGSLLVIFILSFAVFGAAGKPHLFPTWAGNPRGYPDHCPKTS